MPNLQVVNQAGLNIRSGPGTDYEILGTLKDKDIITQPDGLVPFIMTETSGEVTFGWASAKYLQVAPKDAPVPLVPTGVEPAWILWARKELGQKEVPGAGDNPTITAWYHLTTLDPSLWHDSTAWCAVFVNAGFMLNGVRTNRSARAVDWLNFGTPVTVPQKGDVAIFDFGGGDHHVAYVLGGINGALVNCIGGNQHDAVTIANYPTANVMGYRRAA